MPLRESDDSRGDVIPRGVAAQMSVERLLVAVTRRTDRLVHAPVPPAEIGHAVYYGEPIVIEDGVDPVDSEVFVDPAVAEDMALDARETPDVERIYKGEGRLTPAS
ncbi:MAG: hypothetical protein V1926_03860 [Candidatus Peregrinibacteria bacterium]